VNLEALKQHIEEFLVSLEVEKNASAHTIRAYRGDLAGVVTFWEKIATKETGTEHTFQDIVRRYITSLFYQKIKKATLARKLSCLRSLKQYLAQFGINLSFQAKAPRIEKKLPVTLSVDEIFYLLDTVKVEDLPSKFPYRDKAIFELIYATGMRCAELVAAKLNDINYDEKTIRIMGKGKKERMVLFGDKALKSLQNYLDRERGTLVNGVQTDVIFVNYAGTQITTRSVQRIFEMFRKLLKIDRHLTPHKLRHSFATHLLQQGVDLRVIQELLGHQTINTTEIYTKVTSSELAKMCDEKHPLNKLDHLVGGED